MDNVETIIERLFDFYKVTNISQLADKMGTSQARISNWKVRNSISAVKKQCRELNIYNDIFLEKNSNDENIIDDEINTMYDILIDNTKFGLKVKINQLFNSSLPKKAYTFISKNILHRVVNKLSFDDKHQQINKSKQFLVKQIIDTDIKFYETYKLNVLIDIIEDNLSNIECYVLINYYEEIFNYNYKKYYAKV